MTPCTVAHQAPLSMNSPDKNTKGDLPQGSNLAPALQTDCLPSESPGKHCTLILTYSLRTCLLFSILSPNLISPDINWKTKVTALIRSDVLPGSSKNGSSVIDTERALRVFFLSCNPFVIQSQTLWRVKSSGP